MKLPACALVPSAAFLALGAAPAAQGQVHKVDDGKFDYGAVWHVELDPDGSVQSELEIGDSLAGFEDVLLSGENFGASVSPLGDLDNNGTMDLAAGAPGDDTGGNNRGAVWILFRAPDGTIDAHRAIRSGEVPLEGTDYFGSALAYLGDLDGDGRPELAVGAENTFNGGSGAVWILSLEADGSVAHAVRIREGENGFTGVLDGGDSFGASLAAIGDLDGDAVPDLAVGAPGDDDGGQRAGALWILFLNSNGTVKDELKISRTFGGFGVGAAPDDGMGKSVCALGDLDDDGVVDLALGAPGTGTNGGVWIVFLNADGTVRAKQRISSGSGGLSNPTQQGFGAAVAPLGDLDADGIEDLAAGAPDTGAGAVFALALNANGTVKAQRRLERSIAGLATGDRLGAGLAALGDVDGDGRVDLAVGAPARDGIVDAEFTNLQAAVDAAANGDTLLVSNGVYASATIDGKSLTIVGRGESVTANGLSVRNLAATQTVTLKRLRSPIPLENNAGTVWIDECVNEVGFGSNGPGLRGSNCARVVLVRSSFVAKSYVETVSGPLNAPAGLELVGSSAVHAYDCTFRGAAGSAVFTDVNWLVQSSGPGILASSPASVVFLSRCTVVGGNGRYAYSPKLGGFCTPGAPGLDIASETIVLDSVLTGGNGGVDFPTQCAPDGPSTTGPVRALAGEGLSFTMSQLGREGEDVTFTFQGPPFRAVYLIGGPAAQAQFLPALRGSLLVRAPRATEFMGFTDGTGTLEVVRSIGLLPPSFDIRRLYLQPFYFAPGEPTARQVAQYGRATLGAGALYIVLDESF